MLYENKIDGVRESLGQSFIMLVQALSGIRGLTSIAIENLEENELIDKVLEIMNQNLDFERCSLFLINENDELRCTGGKGWDQQAIDAGESHVFKPGEGIIGHTAKTRQLYHCKNSKQDDNYLPIIDAKIDKNAGSVICVPVESGNELLGVLNISHPEPFFFHPWQEHVISIHADIIAQMLHNHRLMKDMATQVKNRTKELQISLDETETLKSKYEALSVIDDLTQIYNRRYFFTEVPSALASALRYNHPLSLLFIDLDHFKTINDSYGHDVGDSVLRDVASMLSKQSRKGDILARMGGEEFALAVPNTEIEGIQLLAQRIKDSVSRLSWEHEGKSFGITLSIGISNVRLPRDVGQSCLGRVNEMVHVLVREADQALYHSKNVGRDKITFFRDLKTRT